MKNIEVYVRYNDYGREGPVITFATIDEKKAFDLTEVVEVGLTWVDVYINEKLVNSFMVDVDPGKPIGVKWVNFNVKMRRNREMKR